jgi:hypothetical protein
MLPGRAPTISTDPDYVRRIVCKPYVAVLDPPESLAVGGNKMHNAHNGRLGLDAQRKANPRCPAFLDPRQVSNTPPASTAQAPVELLRPRYKQKSPYLQGFLT